MGPQLRTRRRVSDAYRQLGRSPTGKGLDSLGVVAQRHGLLEQRVLGGLERRLGQCEEEGALGRQVAAGAARHPRRLGEAADDFAALRVHQQQHGRHAVAVGVERGRREARRRRAVHQPPLRLGRAAPKDHGRYISSRAYTLVMSVYLSTLVLNILKRVVKSFSFL